MVHGDLDTCPTDLVVIEQVPFFFFFFFLVFLLSNKHGYKQYTEQLCCIKQYLIIVYDISTAPTITVKSLI